MNAKPYCWGLPPTAALLLLLLLVGSSWLRPAALAAAPVIPWQGQLTNPSGEPDTAATGPCTIVFNLYDRAAGGTALWTERHEQVQVSQSKFSVFLGSVTALPTFTGNPPTAFFSTTRYLGITVETGHHPATAGAEQVPRQMIIPALQLKIPSGNAGSGGSPVKVAAGGGFAFSSDPHAASLLRNGYHRIAVGQSGEGWRQLPSASLPTGAGGSMPYAPGFPGHAWTGPLLNQWIVWGGNVSDSSYTAAGARFDLTSGRWIPLTMLNAPTARAATFHAWTGSELVIWGGSQAPSYPMDGKTYDPSRDTWTDLPPPPGSVSLKARNNTGESVWIDSPGLQALFIWGGYDSDGNSRGDGALLKKSGGQWTWSQISPANAPGPRHGPCAVWTGSRVIVWGGMNQAATANAKNGTLNDGKLYDPFTNTWSATFMSPVNAPATRVGARCSWTGTEMIVWGGMVNTVDNASTSSGAAYNPTTDQWRTLPSSGLSPRMNSTGSWTGTDFIVHGGGSYEDGGVFTGAGDGARYSPAVDSWTKLPVPAPPGMLEAVSVWTGSAMLFFGGHRQSASSWSNDLWSWTPPRSLYLYQRK